MAGRVGCRAGVYQQNGRVGLQWATSVGVFVLNLGPDLECPVKRSWVARCSPGASSKQSLELLLSAS